MSKKCTAILSCVVLLIVAIVFLTHRMSTRAVFGATNLPAVGAADSPRIMMARGIAYNNHAADGYSSQGGQFKPLIVHSAYYSIESKNIAKTMNQISHYVVSQGGWVANSNLNSSSYDNRGHMNLRIPIAKYQPAANYFQHTYPNIINAEVKSNDITREYIDLKNRLSSLEAAQKQLKAIMQKAPNTKATMDAFHALVDINRQIDVLKGDIKYDNNMAQYALISVDISKKMPAAKPYQWKPYSIVKVAAHKLVLSIQDDIGLLIVFFVSIFPLIILWGGILFLIGYVAYKIFKTNRGEP